MIIKAYVIDYLHNQDNIFLNKNINVILNNLNSGYNVDYTDKFEDKEVIIFAESVILIKEFIDLNNLEGRKCVAITQEGFHETTEETYINYLNNDIYIYCPANCKFYINNFYYFYGIPNGIIDLSNKTKEKYNTDLIFIGSIWRQHWYKKHSLYQKRTEIAIDAYLKGYIKEIYSEDFYISKNPVDSIFEEKMMLLFDKVNRNLKRSQMFDTMKNMFFYLIMISSSYKNFCSERPFESICNGLLPIYMGSDNIKEFFPKDTIIYMDEFINPEECFKYVKNLTFEEWKERMDKCIKIIFELSEKKFTGDYMIVDLFKNVIKDLKLENENQ